MLCVFSGSNYQISAVLELSVFSVVALIFRAGENAGCFQAVYMLILCVFRL